jgi:hypothetical protein
MRCRKKSTPARPYACRFSNFNRWTKPSVGPLLPLNDSPARRARAALRTPGTTARHAFPPGPCPAVIPVSHAALWRGRSIRHKAWTWSSVRGMPGSRGRPRARRACSVERRASGVERHRRAARSGGTAAGRPSAWSAAERGAGAAGRNLPRVAVSRRRWPTARAPVRRAGWCPGATHARQRGWALRPPAFQRRRRDGVNGATRGWPRCRERCRSGGWGLARSRETGGRRPWSCRAMAAIPPAGACHRGLW